MKKVKQDKQKLQIQELKNRIAELERDEAAEDLRYDLLLRKYRMALQRLEQISQRLVPVEFANASDAYAKSASQTLRQLAEMG